MKRLVIYPKDIEILTGRSERFGRKLLADIKEHLLKHRRQLVTIKEFCDYTGLKEEDVRQSL
jgi:hypothetical protein